MKKNIYYKSHNLSQITGTCLLQTGHLHTHTHTRVEHRPL